MSVGTLAGHAESADAVPEGERKLQDGREDPNRSSYATDLLAERLEESLATFGTTRTQGFDAGAEPQQFESVEDVSIIAASQSSMAAAALAAETKGDGSDEDLDAVLADVTATNATLERLVTLQLSIVRGARLTIGDATE